MKTCYFAKKEGLPYHCPHVRSEQGLCFLGIHGHGNSCHHEGVWEETLAQAVHAHRNGDIESIFYI